MKKHILTVALVMVLAMLPAYCGARSTSDGDSSEVVNAAVAAEGKSSESSASNKDDARQGDGKSSGYVLYLSFAGCLGLAFAAGGILWVFFLKKKYDGRLNDIRYEIDKLKTKLDDMQGVFVNKADMRKAIDDVRDGLLEEISQKVETEERKAVAAEKHEEKSCAPEHADVFVKKVYYSALSCSDGFDEQDFVEKQTSSQPFVITKLSPVEAEVVVASGYDQAFNQQVKDMCDTLSGNWNMFSDLTVEAPGILRKESAESDFWTIDSKIKVRLK